jgi:hypothetical protein
MGIIRIKMDKRGVSGDALLWIVRVIGTIFIIGIMVTILNGTIKNSLALEDLRYYPIAERILYSPTCFVSINNNKPNPGIFDGEKLTQENFDGCMKIIPPAPNIFNSFGIKDVAGVKLTIKYGKNEKVLYYNKDYYEDILPLTFSNQYLLEKKRYYVLVSEEGKLIPGNALIEVAWKK